jgi:tetratricopeptide (TPR) repeat protein
VCGWCDADSPHEHVARIAEVPTCEECDSRMRNFPYPNWVRVGFLLLLLAAVISIVMNSRFLFAYFEHRKAARLMNAGQLNEAADLMQTAANRVPEVKDFDILAGCMRGIALLAADDSRGAVAVFQRLVTMDPGVEHFRTLLLHAESGAAFDDKDYDKFLQTSQTLAAMEPGTADSKMRMASAYACLYVARNDRDALAKARQLLAEAKELPASDAEQFEEYYNRILYRIESREIISSKEYARRFPNGWKPPAGAAPAEPTPPGARGAPHAAPAR